MREFIHRNLSLMAFLLVLSGLFITGCSTYEDRALKQYLQQKGTTVNSLTLYAHPQIIRKAERAQLQVTGHVGTEVWDLSDVVEFHTRGGGNIYKEDGIWWFEKSMFQNPGVTDIWVTYKDKKSNTINIHITDDKMTEMPDTDDLEPESLREKQ